MARRAASRPVEEEEDDGGDLDESGSAPPPVLAQRPQTPHAFRENFNRLKIIEASEKRSPNEPDRYSVVYIPDGGSGQPMECSAADIGARPGVYRMLQRAHENDSAEVILSECVVEAPEQRDGGVSRIAQAHTVGIAKTYEAFEGIIAAQSRELQHAHEREKMLRDEISAKDKELGKLQKKLYEGGKSLLGPDSLALMMPGLVYGMSQLSPTRKRREEIIGELLDELDAAGKGELAIGICEHLRAVEAEKHQAALDGTQKMAAMVKEQAAQKKEGEEA